MDFRAEIASAESEVSAAKADRDRADARVDAALRRVGILTGVYHGMSGLDQPAAKVETVTVQAHPPFALTPPRKRARKGEARRRACAMLSESAPEGRTKERLLQLAAECGSPIAEGTLRRALAELEQQGRAKVIDAVWYAVRNDGQPNGEAPEVYETSGASSFHPAEGDDDAATLDE